MTSFLASMGVGPYNSAVTGGSSSGGGGSSSGSASAQPSAAAASSSGSKLAMDSSNPRMVDPLGVEVPACSCCT